MLYLAPWAGAGTRRDPYHVPAAEKLAANGDPVGTLDLRPDCTKADGYALVHAPTLSVDASGAFKLGATKDEALGAVARTLIVNRLAAGFRRGTTATLADRLSKPSNIESLIGNLLFEPDWGWNPVMCDALGRKHVYINGDLLAFRQVAAPPPGQLIDPTDTFTRANENPLAAPWTNNGLADLALTSNRVHAISSTDSCMYYSGAAASADHFAEVTYDANGGGTQDGGPAIRISAGSNDYLSDLFIGGGPVGPFFAKHVAGSFSTIGAGGTLPAWSPGDKHLLWIVGSALRTSLNGTLLAGPTTDTSLTTGQPGIFLFESTVTIQGWRGGDGDGTGGGGGTQFDITPGGSSTPTGTLIRKVVKSIAGSSTPTGAIVKASTRHVVGASTPTGTAVKKAGKPLVGSSTPTGALAVLRAILLSLTGSSTPTGAMRRAIAKPLVGSSTPTGNSQKKTAKAISGSSTPTGILAAIRAILLALTGSSAPTGALQRTAGKSLAGSSTPTSTLRKAVARALAGSSAGSGTVAKAIAKALAGAAAGLGALVVDFISGLFRVVLAKEPARAEFSDYRTAAVFPDMRTTVDFPDYRTAVRFDTAEDANMETLILREGEVLDVTFTLAGADGAPQDLTGATSIKWTVGSASNRVLADVELTVVDPATNGVVRYPRAAELTAKVGAFSGLVTVVFGDASPHTTREFSTPVEILRKPV